MRTRRAPRRAGDVQPSVDSERLLVLGDLIALGQVGVEVVLAGEDAGGLDAAVQRQRRPHGVGDGDLVDDRQGAGEPEADFAHRGVGCGFGGSDDGAAAEHLGAGLELGVDLQPDDGFVCGHVED